ncbi:hypothetical protein PsorP6_009820 [Peronosclerospora sorghi]|uniref:Uncharacterized protein n=1 Tax=Peronosclerospora sorghi TaxID=230839 RepID=A0ACC0W2F4_9STRA|nr:hypothetical protein PsorP6_009820 [Peronosclerospora sorghi]
MKNSIMPCSCHVESISHIHSSAEAQQAQRLQMLAMCENRELTDVILVLQTDNLQAVQEVGAHRVVLATASPFFHALFTSGMIESRKVMPRIPLPEIPVTAFLELLRYMYIGELRVSGESILSILHAANRLELEEVVDICCKQLILELNVSNCVDIYICCDQLRLRASCRFLAHAARAMIDTYFDDVYRSESFKNLSLDAVMKILKHPKESKLGEKKGATFRNDTAAVKTWILHDPFTRQQQVAVVLHSPQKNKVEALPTALTRRKDDTRMVNSMEKLSLVLDKDLAGVDDRATRQLVPTVFVVGGFNSAGALRSIEYLDFHRARWYPAAPMAVQRSYCGVVATTTNKIFVMGGTSSSSHHHNTMETYDPETNGWIAMPSMNYRRSYLGAAVVDNFIYAVGGFNGHAHLASVERFHPQKLQWEPVAPLLTGRSGLAVVALHGLVYAIGGYDGKKHLKSVEVFNPQTNEWSSIASMRYARNGPAAVAHEASNSILVCGGESRHGTRMSTSERLDVTCGTWRDVDALPDCRSGHVAMSVLHESFLFCLGGSRQRDEYLETVQRYDHLSKQWTLHSLLTTPRCGLNVATFRLGRGSNAPLQAFKLGIAHFRVNEGKPAETVQRVELRVETLARLNQTSEVWNAMGVIELHATRTRDTGSKERGQRVLLVDLVGGRDGLQEREGRAVVHIRLGTTRECWFSRRQVLLGLALLSLRDKALERRLHLIVRELDVRVHVLELGEERGRILGHGCRGMQDGHGRGQPEHAKELVHLSYNREPLGFHVAALEQAHDARHAMIFFQVRDKVVHGPCEGLDRGMALERVLVSQRTVAIEVLQLALQPRPTAHTFVYSRDVDVESRRAAQRS